MIIRDAYRFNEEKYVVLADSKSSYPEEPTEGVNWVMSYDAYTGPNGNWKVDAMYSDFVDLWGHVRHGQE